MDDLLGDTCSRQLPLSPESVFAHASEGITTVTDEVVRLSMIGQILRRHWLALAAIAVAGALAGAAVSLLLSPGYQTTSQVLLRDQQVDNEVDAQAQLATSSTVLDRTAAALGRDATGADLRDAVDATISDGGLLEITGAADTPRAAQQLTDQVAAEYVTFANELITTTTDASTQVRLERLEALRQQVEITNQRIDRLHGAATTGELTLDAVRARTQLESLRKDLADAMAQLDEVAVSSSGQEPLIIGPAPLPMSKAPPTMTHLAAGGAGVALLLGGFGFLLAARRDTRLGGSGEIGAALGVPVYGTLPVPDQSSRPRTLWWRSRGQPASSDDDPAEDLRVRRVLTRLASGDDLRLLLVAPDDDPLAHRAVARLAMAAGADDTRRASLRIAHVDPAEPVLDGVGDSVNSAVLVLSSGTRTGWELVGIALACADAGHPLTGSVLAQRATPAPARTPTAPPAGEPGQSDTAATRTSAEPAGEQHRAADAERQEKANAGAGTTKAGNTKGRKPRNRKRKPTRDSMTESS